MLWLLLVPAYFLGTFPSAVWIARTKGIDITKVGSGNPGASNIARTMGNRWGVVVFALDGNQLIELKALQGRAPDARVAISAAVTAAKAPVQAAMKVG